MNTKNIAVILSANATSFKTQMAVASGAVRDFEAQTSASSGTVEKWGMAVKVAAVAIVLALATVVTSAVGMAAEFDRSMRNVNSISKLPEAAFQSLSKQVIQLSTQLPQSADTLAKGLYDIASSGFQGAEGITILNASAKAATAGLSDTATASKAIVAVINAYGTGAGDAARVSDVLFQTVNDGVITFGELASQLGDVVGVSAAAHISINEVGAAIAAMTLSGINAAESTTSLNRLIQSLIQPSDALGAVIHQLGYESGYSMLQTKGLHGTMEILRQVTGGNVEELLKLFPNIRAARGAFALMAADGKNYAKTFADIGTDTAVAGATQKAFAEQMKAVSAQWDIFKNTMEAGLITLGVKLLPVLTASMIAVQDFGGAISDVAVDVGRRLEPFFTNIHDIAANVASALSMAADALTPLAKVLAGLAGLGVITALNAISQAIALITGAMAANQGVVTAFAIALTAIAATKVAESLAILARGALVLVFDGFSKAGTAARNFSLEMTLSQAAVGGLVVGLGLVLSAFAKARSAATEMRNELKSQFDTSTIQGMHDYYDSLVKQTGGLYEASQATQGWQDNLKGAIELMTPLENSVSDARNTYIDYRDALDKLNPTQQALIERTNDIIRITGMSVTEIDSQLKKMGVTAEQFARDDGTTKSKIIANWRTLTETVAGAVGAQGESMNMSVDQMEAVAEAAQKFKDNMAKSFGDATDIVKELGTQVGITAADVLKTYDQMVTAARNWSANMIELAAAGIDDGLLKRLAEAGPKAAPLVQALVNAVRDGNLEAINQAETDLRTILKTTQDALSSYAPGFKTAGIQTGSAVGSGITESFNPYILNTQAILDILQKKLEAVGGIKAHPEIQAIIDRGSFQEAYDAINKIPISRDVVITATIAQTLVDAQGVPYYLQQNRDVPQYQKRWGDVIAFGRGGLTPAHVAQGTRIKYAEPATGGEAYVPRLGNAERSTAVLSHAAKWYGMKVVPMAGGGVTFAGGGATWYTPPDEVAAQQAAKDDKTAAKESAAAERDATKAAREVTTAIREQQGREDVAFKVGAMSPEEYRALLEQRLSDTEQFSSDWDSAWQAITSMDQKAADAEKKAADERMRYEDNEFKFGMITTTGYLAMLDQRLAGLTKFSDEWFTVYGQIKQVEEQAAADHAQLEDNMHRAGVTNTQAYLDILQQRLDGLVKYSDAYMTVEDKITAINEQARRDREKQDADQLDTLRNMVEFGAASADDLITALQNAQSQLEQYSNGWTALQREIDRVKKESKTATALTHPVSQEVKTWDMFGPGQKQLFHDSFSEFANSMTIAKAVQRMQLTPNVAAPLPQGVVPVNGGGGIMNIQLDVNLNGANFLLGDKRQVDQLGDTLAPAVREALSRIRLTVPSLFGETRGVLT